jgi:predicted O-linked N-acetylglucosamine transferase (SPINDLY family)
MLQHLRAQESLPMGFLDRFRTLAKRIRPTPQDLAASAEKQALDWILEGNALEREGQIEEAMQRYDAAIRQSPAMPRAHLNRGNLLLLKGDAKGAMLAYSAALACDPGYAAGHFNMGNAYAQSGRHQDALAAYTRAIALKPDFTDALVALGCTQEDLQLRSDAQASYRRALVLAPDYAQVHNNLGNVLRDSGQFEDAVHSYARCIELQPEFAPAHANLTNVLQSLGKYEAAENSCRRALAITPGDLATRTSLLFALNFRNDHQEGLALSEARQFGAWAARNARPFSHWPNKPDVNKCLRVGFVSGDFQNHPVAYFLEGVVAALAQLSEGRLTLLAYPTHIQADQFTQRLKRHFHVWRPVADMNDERLAHLLRDDALDLLIDLSGHTGHNRLGAFAWKPAPVQLSWLGYFATTGVGAIDYLIADPWTLPLAEEANFTEKIWRLPHTRLCFTPPDDAPPVSELPALRAACVTFACFNNLGKMSDAVARLWSRVLLAVPGSRLFLKSPQLGEASVRHSVRARFAALGIDGERLILEGLSPRAEYLAAYQRVDIALDPFPYTGGTTTMEALYMGVPVLTLAGSSLLSRQGLGLLMNAGLPEWVAGDADAYVRQAIANTADLPQLAALRGGLRAKVLASALFDAPLFAGHFEAALRGMWRDWCNNQLPPFQ